MFNPAPFLYIEVIVDELAHDMYMHTHLHLYRQRCQLGVFSHILAGPMHTHTYTHTLFRLRTCVSTGSHLGIVVRKQGIEKGLLALIAIFRTGAEKEK